MLFNSPQISIANSETRHPDIKTAARFVAPANTDDGVVTVLQHLLGV